MNEFNNPFSIDRAEQLGNKLFEFYANHKSFDGLLKHKSLIIEGGRGSGKTMFFLYHTFFSKKEENLSKGLNYNEFLQKEELIGIHFRCDSNFVPAFQKKGIKEEEWYLMFSHYLNIALSKRLIEIILDVNQNVNKDNFIKFDIEAECKSLLRTENKISSYAELKKILSTKELDIINYVNNSNSYDKPHVIANGYLLNLIAKHVLSQPILKNKSIHIFIDEYENLLQYQQQILNTLIKHPDPVIFDIGMRHSGIKTYQTLSESEIISYPHDFQRFNFEDLSREEFEELLIKICRIRLEKIPELKSLNQEKYFDIKFYLGEFRLDDELEIIFKKRNWDYLITQLKVRIGEKDTNSKILFTIDNPIHLRLHLILLERGEKLSFIIKEYDKYINKEKSKYKDWLHNNSLGIIFLLAKENKQSKTYSGFNNFTLVSSGIIRYFIELCEASFKNANRSGFDFNKPRQLSVEEQTKAAYAVSRYKVNDIDTYTPNSVRLKRFILLLGRIFNNLHHDNKLSEPERNHFTTQNDKLSLEAENFIKNSVLYSVLQKRELTKDKSNVISSENFEYHLNHIYAPYFQISPRRIRSLSIPYDILEVLMLNKSNNAEKVATTFLKTISKSDSQLSIF